MRLAQSLNSCDPYCIRFENDMVEIWYIFTLQVNSVFRIELWYLNTKWMVR